MSPIAKISDTQRVRKCSAGLLAHWALALMTGALLTACGKKAGAPAATAGVEQGGRTAGSEEKVTFNEHIRPIFSDTCFACHGFDAKHRKADLRLDTFEGATAKLKESDEYAIVPGKPEQSAVWKRLVTTDEKLVMPPVEFHKVITEPQKALIRKWIEQGAQYEPHWAYKEIKRPEVPVLKKHAAEVANPIDAFILAKLEKAGIEPAPLADRATLVRRLSLDLTGLPPSDDELKKFATAPWADVVKHYLATPAYGERMAVPWLDAVRFADTVGFHGDQNQRIFPYRDYVIDAFRKNKRFDTFVTEQLAGDLLPSPTDEQLIATGFLRLNQMTREGGAQKKEYLAKYAADRVRAVGAAFLGQTTGCAECHDHKYDPISAEDFYSMAAFFADVQQWGVYDDYNYTPEPELKDFKGNDAPYPPELMAKSGSLLDRIRVQQKELLAFCAALPVAQPELDAWKARMAPFLASHPDGWQALQPGNVSSAAGTAVVVAAEQTVLPTGAPKDKDVITVRLPLPEGVSFSQVRLEVLPDAANGGKVGRGADGHFGVSAAFAWAQAGAEPQPLAVRFSQADLDIPASYSSGYRKNHKLDAVWRSTPGPLEQPQSLAAHPHTAVYAFDAPRVATAGSELVVTLTSNDIGKFRLSISPFLEAVPGMAAAPAGLAEALKQSAPGAADAALIRSAYQLCSQALIANPEYKSIIDKVRECDAGWARTLVSVPVPEKKRLVTRILPRGNWQDESGKVVEPAVLHFLPSATLPKDRRLTRLDLAKWITAPENPLTARHFVNRLWKQFFGSGISNVLNDLGGQGEWPSHPELLDWLAAEFRESGWDVNHMVTLMVTSRSYQQEAAKRDDLAHVDPLNRLIAQQSARRLDAEFVRDNALAVAGLLEQSYAGGPSVFPYQPAGYYEPMNFPVRDYINSKDNRQYRRGVYMHWQRSYLHPMLQNFDAPSREECAADRLQANTPLQALTMLNDPTFNEAARAFAARVMSEQPQADPAARIKRIFHLAMAREPKPEELKSLQDFLAARREDFRSGRDNAGKFLAIGLFRAPATLDANELAAWTQVCRVVLNLHESITRY